MNLVFINAGNAPFKIILYVTGGRFPQQYNGTFYGIAHCILLSELISLVTARLAGLVL